MSLHTAAVFVHVLAAAFLVGHGLATPHVLSAIRAAPTVQALLPWLGFARDSARATPAAALLLLATGVSLASGRWDEGWLWVSTGLFVVASALAVGVVKATGERLAALAVAAAEGPVPPALEAVRRTPRWALAAELLVATDVASLFLMVAQPGLAGSVAAVAAAPAAVLALRALRGRRAAAGQAGVPSAA